MDIPAARSSGVRVANIPSTGTGNAAACAEMALLLTLSLLRNTKAMAKSLADRTLGSPTGTMLAGKSALLIGFGSIARETVTRLAALGVRVAAVKRSPWVENDPEARLLADRGGPDDMHRMLVRWRVCVRWPSSLHALILAALALLQGMADVVVLTCTLNETTRHLADARFLQAMRRGAVLVNVARGGLMEYGAVREVCACVLCASCAALTGLPQALESGHLGGLGTDVAWSEPWDPEDPVASHPRCVMTPHVAGVTDVSYRAMARIVADEARRHARGEGPSDRVAVFAP